MPRLATALLAGLALAVGIAACGGGNSDTSDVIPKTTPDLVAPKDTSLPDAVTSTTTTSPTTTPTTTPVTPSTGTGAAGGGTSSGGTSTAGGTSSGGTGTTGNSSGGFGSFCQQNPGAC